MTDRLSDIKARLARIRREDTEDGVRTLKASFEVAQVAYLLEVAKAAQRVVEDIHSMEAVQALAAALDAQSEGERE